MTDELAERVAKIMCDDRGTYGGTWEHRTPATRGRFVRRAREAVLAVVPEGCVVVDRAGLDRLREEFRRRLTMSAIGWDEGDGRSASEVRSQLRRMDGVLREAMAAAWPEIGEAAS